jgi:hypothetical protein
MHVNQQLTGYWFNGQPHLSPDPGHSFKALQDFYKGVEILAVDSGWLEVAMVGITTKVNNIE